MAPPANRAPSRQPHRQRAGEGRLWVVGGLGWILRWRGGGEGQLIKNRNVKSLREYFVVSTHNDKFLILKKITNFLSTSFNSFSANCPTLPIAKL